jgi:hypothetical protein
VLVWFLAAISRFPLYLFLFKGKKKKDAVLIGANLMEVLGNYFELFF